MSGDNEEPQGLTIGLVKQSFRHTFPGAQFEIHDRLGGKVLASTIWQFHVELSVTERSIAYTDSDGEVTVSITFQPDKKKRSIIHQESTTSPTRVLQLVEDTRKFLEGIAAAITTACEEPYYDDTEDVRDLFE